MTTHERLEQELDSLREEFAAAVAAPRTGDGRSATKAVETVILLSVEEDLLAVPAADVLQVIPTTGMVPVPGAGRSILGAVTYRQQVYALLPFPPEVGTSISAGPWALLFRSPGRRCGLIVSALEEVLHCDSRELDALRSSGAAFHSFRHDNRTLTVLNTSYLLQHNE